VRVYVFFVAFGAALGALVAAIAHSLSDDAAEFGYTGTGIGPASNDIGFRFVGPAWWPLAGYCIGVGLVVGVLVAFGWRRLGLRVVRERQVRLPVPDDVG
jgi:hypothetical protein